MGRSNTSFCSKSEMKIYFTIFITFMALIFTWFAAFDCSFFTLNLPNASTGGTESFGFGLWTVQQAGASTVKCQLWESAALKTGLDSSFKFARAMSMMAMIISIPVTILSSMTLFLQAIKQSYLYIQAILMYFLTILTVLEFVALDSQLCDPDFGCKMSVSGAYAIVAAVMWFVAGIGTFFLDSAEDSPKQVRPVVDVPVGTAPATVEEKRTTLADGSIVVTTVTTQPDGQRTSQERIEAAGEDGKLEDVPLEDL